MFQKSIYKEEFKNHLEKLGYSKGSQHTLPTCIAEFLSQLEEKGIYELHQIKPNHIQAHYEYLTQRPNKRRSGGLSSMMISHHIYAIRLFLNYHEQIGTITENPISSLYFPNPEYQPRAILTQTDIRKLYNACETLRDRAILSLFYGCGLRRSETEKLNIKDIHFKEQILYVREGKGKKRRAIPMSEQVVTDLKNYYLHERYTNKTEQSFIINKLGTRMRADSYIKRLKRLLKKAGLSSDICLHSLRHSIATHLLENGLSIEYVRDFLGHENLETTQIYTHISKQLQNL